MGDEKPNVESPGNPNLIYESKMIYSWEPTGEVVSHDISQSHQQMMMTMMLTKNLRMVTSIPAALGSSCRGETVWKLGIAS